MDSNCKSSLLLNKTLSDDIMYVTKTDDSSMQKKQIHARWIKKVIQLQLTQLNSCAVNTCITIRCT